MAMRELVPAATAPLPVSGGVDRSVLLCTVLPGAAPALVREDGEVWLALQVRHHFGDPSRDLAAVLERALARDATVDAGPVGLTEPPGPGPRLQDLVVDEPLRVTVHAGLDFWLSASDGKGAGEVGEALQRANDTVHPTARLTCVEAAYWTRIGAKEHLRWVLPEPEEALLDALARLHVTGGDVIAADARLVGMFRTHGLLVPVWDLPVGTGAEALEEPAERLRARLDELLADDTELTREERSARAGLATRQVTIR